MTTLTDEQRRFLDGARAEAARLRADPAFPAAEVTRIEQAVERVRTSPGVAELRRVVARVDRYARIDVDVPTDSRLPFARWVKVLVKRTVGWYLSFVGQRITLFGRAVAHLGAALTDRVELLEDQVGELRERVERLEGEQPAGPAGPAGPGGAGEQGEEA